MTLVNPIPVFKLYGEHDPWLTPDMLHCESIAARSRLHNWQIKPHRHNGLLQILYLEGGSAKVQLDDVPHALRAGQVLTVPPMCIHGFKFSRNAQGKVITLAMPLVDKLAARLADGLAALHIPRIHTLGGDMADGLLKTAFGTLEEEYKHHAANRNPLIEFLLGSILIHVARSATPDAPEMPRESSKASRHFNNFSRLIEERHASQHLVAYYARHVGISAAHLNVLCRQTAGKSALELIHERLLLEARRDLVYTTMTISEVSYALGFSDPAYFTRFFKRQTGMSPKDFRRQAGTLFGSEG